MTSEPAGLEATGERPLEVDWAAEGAAGLKATGRATPRRARRSLTLSERRWLLKVADLLLINASLVAVAVVWLELPLEPVVLLSQAKWFVTLSAVWLVIAGALDLYNPQRAASTTHSVLNSGVAALVTGGVYAVIPWLTPPPTRRGLFVGLTVLMVLLVVAWRAAYARFFSQPGFQRRALIVGQDATAQRVAGELQAAAGDERANPFRGTGYEVVGLIETLPVGEVPGIDPAHSLVRLIRQEGVDEVLVAEGAEFSAVFQEALLDCREMGIAVTPLATVYERLTARLPVAYAERDLGLILDGHENPTQRLYLVAKRAMDLALAVGGLGLLGLLAPWIALGNGLGSPGPLFYRQERVGRGGRPFVLVKFRTMVPDAEPESGAVWATAHDPRVTAVGRWLRRLRLDELPQVLNVLRGEMSIVGPRPERPQFVGEISRVLPLYRVRHSVLPGITGWAQVRYRYGRSTEDARVKLEYDLYYIKHANLALDLMIVLQTLLVVLGLQAR